jgi:hypothetical protein
VAAAERQARSARPENLNDSFLHALLSHIPLSSRQLVLEFLWDRMRDPAVESQHRFKSTLLDLFRKALYSRTPSDYDSYSPARVHELRTVPARFAAYSLNLLILLLIACGEISGRELFPDPKFVVAGWRRDVRLWWSHVEYESWLNLVRALDLQRCWVDEERDVIIRWTADQPSTSPLPDLYWTYEKAPDHEMRGHSSWMYEDFPSLSRILNLPCGYEEELLLNAVAPLVSDLSMSLMTVVGHRQDRAESPANGLIRMWLVSSGDAEPAELADAYIDCLWLGQVFPPVAEKDAFAYLEVVLGHLKHDASRLRGVLTWDSLRLKRDMPALVAKIRSAMTDLGLV